MKRSANDPERMLELQEPKQFSANVGRVRIGMLSFKKIINLETDNEGSFAQG